MVTAFFYLFWAAFASLMSIFVLGNYFIILWVILGLAVAYLLTMVIFIYAQVPLMKHTKLLSKFRGYMTRSIAYWSSTYIFNVHAKGIGRKNIPKTGPVVLFSNHKSFVDPFVIMRTMTRGCGYSPKSTLYKSFTLRQWFEIMRCLMVDRDSAKNTAMNMVNAIKDVKNGYAMVVFPEGTSKNRESEDMEETKAGAFKIAVKAKAPIVPVTIMGTIGTYQRMPWRPTRVKVIYHKPIYWEEYQNLNTAQLGDKVLHIINEGVEEYKNNI